MRLGPPRGVPRWGDPSRFGLPRTALANRAIGECRRAPLRLGPLERAIRSLRGREHAALIASDIAKGGNPG